MKDFFVPECLGQKCVPALYVGAHYIQYLFSQLLA